LTCPETDRRPHTHPRHPGCISVGGVKTFKRSHCSSTFSLSSHLSTPQLPISYRNPALHQPFKLPLFVCFIPPIRYPQNFSHGQFLSSSGFSPLFSHTAGWPSCDVFTDSSAPSRPPTPSSPTLLLCRSTWTFLPTELSRLSTSGSTDPTVSGVRPGYARSSTFPSFRRSSLIVATRATYVDIYVWRGSTEEVLFWRESKRMPPLNERATSPWSLTAALCGAFVECVRFDSHGLDFTSGQF
jgi:hypothetical protein